MTPEEKVEIEEKVKKMTRQEACKRMEEFRRMGAHIEGDMRVMPVKLMHERQLVEMKCGT